MRTLISISKKTVFIKTEKGREEILQRQHGLVPKHRRVLIVIDGNKNLEDLSEMIPAIIPAHELQQIVFFLSQQGFIMVTKERAKNSQLAALEKTTTPQPAMA